MQDWITLKFSVNRELYKWDHNPDSLQAWLYLLLGCVNICVSHATMGGGTIICIWWGPGYRRTAFLRDVTANAASSFFFIWFSTVSPKCSKYCIPNALKQKMMILYSECWRLWHHSPPWHWDWEHLSVKWGKEPPGGETRDTDWLILLLTLAMRHNQMQVLCVL